MSTPKNIFISTLMITSLLVSGCSKSSDSNPAVAPTDNGNGATQSPPPPEVLPVNKKCIQVYYDRGVDLKDQVGKVYALMVLNLLGHFPQWQQALIPLDLYKKGDLDRCAANIYIASNYYEPKPFPFITDYRDTKSAVAWLGYGIWDLGNIFDQTFGYSYDSLTELNPATVTANGDPAFFKYISYKGKAFVKYGKWNKNKTEFESAYELARLKPISTQVMHKSEVISYAQDSLSGERIPWALKAGNKFYVSEVPLSYISESDRYLIFADMLFDLLKETPRHNQKYAFIRMEDIHPHIDLNTFSQALDILKKENVTPHISLIPIFRDPFHKFGNGSAHDGDTLLDVPAFKEKIQAAAQQGAVFIWHGVTHQQDDNIDPFTGTSGDDYEFWDAIHNLPVASDSGAFVTSRMQKGFDVMTSAGISPKLWVTPHYRASALDNIVFGQMFNWVIGRNEYYDFSIAQNSDPRPRGSLFISADHPERFQDRLNSFSQLAVTENNTSSVGQIFPYELYGDVYGENLIPENLGNVQPTLNTQVVATRTVDEILQDAKRNLVLRDVWASAFYHPFLLADTPTGQTPDLEKLVKGLKDLGYQFINLNEWTAAQTQAQRAPVIERK